jgi:hypothetical protein
MARQPQTQQPAPPPEPATATGGPPPLEAGGVLTIDLDAIRSNYRMLLGRVLPGDCAAVVKGDAYGCGIDRITATLDRAGCRVYFVANLDEARSVRAIANEAAIYVLNGFSSAAGPAFRDIRARPVINSSVELAEWDHFVATTGWTGGAALHIDTGMNRLGLTIEEAAAVAHRIQSENHGVELLMSHLACADQPNHPLNDKQIRQFRELRSLFRGISSSLANSSGIFLEWNTLVEEAAQAGPSNTKCWRAGRRRGRDAALIGRITPQGPRLRADRAVDAARSTRRRARGSPTGIAEFDRVTGGGFVRGSALLIGGDPGIGKSTLLMQAAAALARAATGRLHLRRGGGGAGAAARRAARPRRRAGGARRRDQRRGHPRHARRRPRPALVVIDSIQTLWTDRPSRARHRDAGARARRRR